MSSEGSAVDADDQLGPWGGILDQNTKLLGQVTPQPSLGKAIQVSTSTDIMNFTWERTQMWNCFLLVILSLFRGQV